jgi:hypothetical protein
MNKIDVQNNFVDFCLQWYNAMCFTTLHRVNSTHYEDLTYNSFVIYQDISCCPVLKSLKQNIRVKKNEDRFVSVLI